MSQGIAQLFGNLFGSMGGQSRRDDNRSRPYYRPNNYAASSHSQRYPSGSIRNNAASVRSDYGAHNEENVIDYNPQSSQSEKENQAPQTQSYGK